MNRRLCALFLAALSLALAALGGMARAADAAEVELGMKIYQTTGGCAKCHAWTGRGALLYDSGIGFLDPPPSLIRSTLDRKAMIELLACGTPGGKMPQFLGDAWTERFRCAGKTADDLPADKRPPHPYTILTMPQIEALASFVAEVYQGHGMSLENCLKYFGPPAPMCVLIP